MIDCSDCVRKKDCDLYVLNPDHVNKDICMCKTWYDENGLLDNNTRRYLNKEELK